MNGLKCYGVFTEKEYSVSEWFDGVEECTMRFPIDIPTWERYDFLNKRHIACSDCRGCPEKLNYEFDKAMNRRLKKCFQKEPSLL